MIEALFMFFTAWFCMGILCGVLTLRTQWRYLISLVILVLYTAFLLAYSQ